MIHKVVAIYDAATQAYGRPIFVAALGQATRSFTDEVNSKEPTDLARHPGDFELYHLADFDDNSAQFLTNPEPIRLMRGSDVKEG